MERQQHYQESLQSISTKMESIEGTLNEGLEPNKSPESQMAAHQVSKWWRSEDSEECVMEILQKPQKDLFV